MNDNGSWGTVMVRKRFGVVVTCAVTLGLVGFSGVGTAVADQVILSCSASAQTATLNPPIGSAGAKYYKSASKTGGGATCLVDSGIRTDVAATNSASGKDNPFDNQTNGQGTLTVLSSVSSTAGTITCNTVDPSHNLTYPTIYPGQGKLTTKFVETDLAGRNLQLQAYIRFGIDAADPDQYDVVVQGLVTKGVGVGGSVHAVISIFPDLASPKNLNLPDCVANPAVGNASIAVMNVTPADGSDAGTAVDPWTVSLP